ncbi:hypothetical protein [Paracoccus aminophilus]|uniref:Uncharacterized protein n=1 Tax=Paracoccus aminophilus JCM 7686 TaxID=1367847 RepID=S5XV46_PARAH|nr:hypothetical protein [Paracoccus aminophilus]AGT09087.1 hypothetical protein JCM7686_1986 [Paracoccus aminophilus JCM 7686]
MTASNSPSPDHMHLLALARRALDAEPGPIWKTDPEEAVKRHGAVCNAVWDELRRQIEAQDGKVPVLEHPSVKQKALAKRMRANILAACKGAIDQALDEVEFS